MQELDFFYRGRWAIAQALRELGLNEGDTVLFQAYTCIAVPKGIVAAKMKPVIIDTKEGSLFVDQEHLENVILAEKVKCFIVQHTFGFICPQELFTICKKHNVKIIEDCAHLFQGYDRVYKKELFGDARIFSLEWGKPIPCGIGGVLEMDFKRVSVKPKVSRPMRWLKLELQYFAFSLVYRPSLFFFTKKIFNLLKGTGIVEDNGMNGDFLFKDNQEEEIDISPFVKRRYLRLHKRFSGEFDMRLLEKQKFVKQFNQFQGLNKLNLDFANAFPLRIPVIVSDKKKVLLEAEKERIPLGDWYDTPIDPIPNEVIKNHILGADLLVNSRNLSEKVVTIPLDKLQSTMLMTKTLNFLAEHG